MPDAFAHRLITKSQGGIPMTDDRSTTTLDSTPSGQDAATRGTETHPLAETGREAGQRAGQLVERGAEIGIQQADRGLNLAASGADAVADSIRRVSVDMEAGQPQISEFASTAADQAEALAKYLRETDVRQIIGNVENFARRQPLLFVGGAFLAGMATSRFIKAAGGKQDQNPSGGPGYRSANGSSSASYGTGTRRRAGSGEWSATGPGADEEV
jgi:hypothetical protein